MKFSGEIPIQLAAEYLFERVLGGRSCGVPCVSWTVKSSMVLVKLRGTSVSLMTLRMPSVLSPGLSVFSMVGGTIVMVRTTSWAEAGWIGNRG